MNVFVRAARGRVRWALGLGFVSALIVIAAAGLRDGFTVFHLAELVQVTLLLAVLIWLVLYAWWFVATWLIGGERQ